MSKQVQITAQNLIEAGYTEAPWFIDVIRVAKKSKMSLEAALRYASNVYAQHYNKPETFSARHLVLAGFEMQGWVDDYVRKVNAEGLPPAEALSGASEAAQAWIDAQPKFIPLQEAPAFSVNMTAENDAERANMDEVVGSFAELMRTPTLVAGAIMPDACPAGAHGTITVGGVVGAKNAIHPGMHSADICCSMFVTVLDTGDAKSVLDKAMEVTHFGGAPRIDGRFRMPDAMVEAFEGNKFLRDELMIRLGHFQMGTQGDGNHFFYVGHMADGRVAMVTHHGSRAVGGRLYKQGMVIAERFRLELSPDTRRANSWIPADSREGQEYWKALQILRDWTKENHRVLHDAVAEELGLTKVRRLWNEHNFVFKDGDIYWHAKGATPIHNPLMPDTDGIQIVPMNMGQPILLVRGTRTGNNLGFAPHGAGRNFSRTQHLAMLGDESIEDVYRRETAHIDARFFSGKVDTGELPSAYKDAGSVQRDMERFGLCEVVEVIRPYGSIMAGEQPPAPWEKKDEA